MINKKIFYLIFEIVSLISLIFITNNVWNKLDTRASKVAYAYSNYESELYINVDNDLSPLIPVDDDKVNEEETINIEIINTNKTNKEYNLYFIIKDDTTLNKDNLKIKINNEVNYLKELKNQNKDGYTYYKITTGKINKQSKNLVALNLYLSSETPNSEQGKNMNINFKIEEI